LSLPSGQHYGFISQEVEQNFPHLVKNAKSPSTSSSEEDNSDEVIINNGVEFKSIYYLQVIPLLVGAVQENKEELNSLNDQINLLEQAIIAAKNALSE
jgi:hypothetical protein